MNILKIIDNEWMSPSGNWDLTVVGRKLTIRESQRNIVLELTAYPPNAIEVSNLEMYMPGQPYKLKGNANDFSIIYPSGEASIIKNCTFENNNVDIRLG
jgi:hypothetical protein